MLNNIELTQKLIAGSYQEDHAERRGGGQGCRPSPRHHLPSPGAFHRDPPDESKEGDGAERSPDPNTQSHVSEVQSRR